MRDLARIFQDIARRNRTIGLVLAIPAAAASAAIALILVTIAVLFAVVVTQNAGGCGTTVAVGAPSGVVMTPAAIVQYFESQGISENGAAGIEGNLQQESGLNPEETGGGFAQWLRKRWSDMVTWTTQQGYPGDSPNPRIAAAGQVMYIVYDLRTSYSTLMTELNSAADAGTAATMFETVYEICSGVLGYMDVVPGSLCNDTARREYAAEALTAAGGVAVPVSLGTGGTCVAVGGSGGDPIPGFRPGRDDMGVDACANDGMPIYAPAASTLVGVIPNWFTDDSTGRPQPLMLFQFAPSLAGAYRGDEYWYVAEQIVPVTTTIGTTFGTGQPVAWYGATGTCIEIGWGSPTNGSRTLVPTDASPPRGKLTPEAEAFKTYFHIPWVGQSP